MSVIRKSHLTLDRMILNTSSQHYWWNGRSPTSHSIVTAESLHDNHFNPVIQVTDPSLRSQSWPHQTLSGVIAPVSTISLLMPYFRPKASQESLLLLDSLETWRFLSLPETRSPWFILGAQLIRFIKHAIKLNAHLHWIRGDECGACKFCMGAWWIKERCKAIRV